MSIVDEVADHFERQFRTLEGAYERASEGAWAYTDPRVKGVWQWLLHILETIEFYFGEEPADRFPWGHRFGLDWENDRPERVPARDELRAYQEDVAQLVRRALDDKMDEDLVAPETVAPWTGRAPNALYVGKLLYVMRHTQQHIGDINRVLRLNDCDALAWH